ncbi:MAG: lipoyl(octanoyl) transferase LipB [Arthrobacter sp.]|uniref:lipoyl(octanoyl) transferase LipB n=1 Tax=unclassified Arthrobacter TaxID=235627 RepID=UPI00264B8219|nr:lipoyl(octanoyl) transferase LipB [Micrococcaceae bacterium]MDN5812931.1 lipoyl(octanoyl) transferase LipB [Micrococcaceae bacterium]MDN5824711.1 lipoyl(octanoyl) transferase LipB [Micrococcaceae bacterium]MDN5880309.1 lipoyl(octanoyl) transferase LipB [Micrococcaceae bacterium]MDN5887710.1 lipoyl(octanoyl) transferase LipB [Micrococcaceae bacterium]
MTISFQRLGFAPDYVDYQEAWDLQRRIHDEVAARMHGPEVLLLEHAAVYTAGKRTEPQDLPVDGTPVISVDRGGKITWHGPGQLVGYPIVELANHSGIRDYVHRLEEMLINVVADFGITAQRVDGRAGVWVLGTDGAQDRKIAAIGIRVDHGVTMHGFALNCDNDDDAFSRIIPCGITDASTTSITEECGRTVRTLDVLDRVQDELTRLLEPAIKTNTPIADEGALL